MLPVADRVSPVRSSALPSFRSAVLPCGVPGQVLEEVHADILEFRTDQSEAEEENPHVVLRALGAEGTLVFRARTLRILGEGGDGEAGLLQLKLPTSTLVGFLINGLIMNILQHIFPQAENLVFQFQKSRGRIFCVFPRLLLLQSKSLRPLLAGEFVGRSSETQREMRKQRILSGTANGPIPPQNQPQKRKKRPEVRSAENQENGRGERIRTSDFHVPNVTL